jgi:hypothetical protein
MIVHPESPATSELAGKAHQLYERLRDEVETPDNIGKFIVMEVDSGDYEIDEQGIESSHRLQSRYPGVALYALRIGYKTAVSFCGGLERLST